MRKVLKRVSVIAGILIAVGLILFLVVPRPALAVSFTMEGDSLTNEDGTVTEVKADVTEAEVEWDGLEIEPVKVKVELQVQDKGGNWFTVTSATAGVSGKEGEYKFKDGDISEASVLGRGSQPWQTSDFEAADGETKDTTLTARLYAVLLDSENNEIISGYSSAADFTISVTNEAEEIEVGGKGKGIVH